MMTTKPKKILFINPKQFGYAAGYHYYCKYLAKDFDITYICIDFGLPKIEIDGVTVKYLNLSHNKYTRLFKFTYACLYELRSNLYSSVFCVYFRLAFLIGIFGSSKNKILDIRTRTISNNIIYRTFFDYVIKFNSLFFKKNVALSEALKQALNLSKAKCFIIPLGADIVKTKKKYMSFHLLYIGTFNNRRIYETIEGLYLFLRNKKINIKYDIIGFGSKSDTETIISTINKFGLSNIVKFHGRKNHHELVPFFSTCNIGVSYVPITPYFNCQPPTKTYEYALSGMACVATETNENKKLINYCNGELCKDTPNDFACALEKLYNRRQQLKTETIINSLKDNSWNNIVSLKLKPLFQTINPTQTPPAKPET